MTSSCFLNLSSPLPFTQTHRLSLPLSLPPKTQIKNGWDRRVLILRVKCLTKPNGDVESEAETSSSSSSASGSAGISTYSWCAGLGGIGFLETSYLTYLKLTNSDAFCPIGGGSCGDVLNSDYASVFGVPLPLIGMFAYGLVTILGIQLAGKNLPLGLDENNGRLILLGSTTSMAAASAYFLYILSTKFAGASCSYCLVSVLLSFSLLFATIKDYGLQEIQKVVGLQLCLGGLAVAILSTSYNMSQYFPISSVEIDLPFSSTEVTTESSPLTLALARHLHSAGAKMYGAFWCSHCLEQKQMFGREAAKLLDVVECFPDGYRKGTIIAKACADVGIEGFPTWVINGEVLSGELDLSELARISGFKLDDFVQSQ
ncbi:Thiol-disulfide oxidoreductase [Actinidia chinensis var. chinensis]|uniref:Thiol-disulfide oxidoreductase n=1 Tax=Actinidia chinensis var. chinensis TaxID=1590841 RepID=A0A2R6Q225_ACTCC|nr:Thiol-disulfide oxidoreductase [Actinidia chinensis var. chinensis]